MDDGGKEKAMFFKNTLRRIEDKLVNVEYLVAERIKMECDHPSKNH